MEKVNSFFPYKVSYIYIYIYIYNSAGHIKYLFSLAAMASCLHLSLMESLKDQPSTTCVPVFMVEISNQAPIALIVAVTAHCITLG
jgi:hypothetical protein